MEHFLGLCVSAAAGSADVVAGAAEDEQKHLGPSEAPGEFPGRAAALREGLCRFHREATPDDARELLALAREILGGVWATIAGDISGAYAERGAYARRGGAWAWGVLGRSLGIEASGPPPYTA